METTNYYDYLQPMTRANLMGAAGALALTATLGGCGAKSDPRLEMLTAGIAKDSVYEVMGVERPEKILGYLVAGDYIEVMYFPIAGAIDSASITERKMSPVIVVGGKLVAWGWRQWDSMAAAKSIPVPPK